MLKTSQIASATEKSNKEVLVVHLWLSPKIGVINLLKHKYVLELSMGEKERAHATQLQRAEREAHALRGEVKQLRGRMEAAQAKTLELQHLKLQLAEK